VKPRSLLALAISALLGLALAESVPLLGATLSVTGDARTVTYRSQSLTYVEGLGWLDSVGAAPPRLEGGVVWVAAEIAALLGAQTNMLPPTQTLAAVRISTGAQIRMVLDLPGLDADTLRPLSQIGTLSEGPLVILVPTLSSSPLPTAAGPFDLSWGESAGWLSLKVSGPPFGFEVFALAHPTRLVIDLLPASNGVTPPGVSVEEIAPGIIYRTFRAPSSNGASRVHVLEVAPSAGNWAVRAEPGTSRTTLQWLDGAIAGINGGYFNTANREAIGLLIVDGAWVSPPSRNRAAVAFGPDGVTIARVQSSTAIWADEVQLINHDDQAARELGIYEQPGSFAGTRLQGVLAIDHAGFVLANRIGPLAVPDGGFVLSYPPQLRNLAMVEPGARLRFERNLTPSALQRASFAVEAGPLLLQGGRDAFMPELESFARGVRILDDVTQQAAIGVRADGTVLLVAAETMTAADLIPLFLSLEAVDAMRLDSGGSTTLVAAGRSLNRTSERAVANAIALIPKRAP